MLGCIALLAIFIGMGIIWQVGETNNPLVSRAEASEYEVVPGSDFVRITQEVSPINTFHVVHFSSPENVVAVKNLYQFNDGGDIYHSSDGGKNFELARYGAAPIRGTFSFPEENIGYAAGGRSGLGVSMYLGKTEDGGETWTDLHENLVVLFNPSVYQVLWNVAAPDKDRVFTVTSDALYGSNNGGESWYLVEGNQDYYGWSLDVVDGRTYIASHSDFQFLSADSDTWTTIPAPWDHDSGFELKDLYFENTSRGWALIEDINPDDRMLRLHRTDNGGQSWMEISSALRNDLEIIFPRDGRSLIAHGGKLFGVGRITVNGRTSNHVVTSENGGITWNHDAWNAQFVTLRLLNAAGELHVYSNITGSGLALNNFGLYKPGAGVDPDPDPVLLPPTPTLQSPADGSFVAGTLVTFTWNAAERAENYQLRIIKQSDGTVFYNQQVGNTTSNTITGFSDNEVYCWQVRAGNDTGWSDFSDSFCFTIQVSDPDPDPVIDGRLAGDDRFQTAITISKDSYPEAKSAGAVVIARSHDFADALPGGVLANKENGPLLLTGTQALNAEVQAEIDRVLSDDGTIYILGGTLAISPATETQLRNMGYTVQRIAGGAREETAFKIAEEVGNSSGKAIIANSRSFPDALAISSYAAMEGIPILTSAAGSLSADAAKFLTDYNVDEVYVVGGTEVISNMVFLQIEAIVGTGNVERLGGNDRYETASNIANRFFPAPTKAALAFGFDFPDALAGGVNAAMQEAPILLVNRDIIPPAIRQYLTSKGGSLDEIIVYGGTAAVNDSVMVEANNLIK